MKGLKRFVSVFAIAAMTVSLVGCGGGNSESSDEKVFRFGKQILIQEHHQLLIMLLKV